MKWPVWTVLVVLLITGIGLVMIQQKSIIPPSVLGEFTVPHLISDEAWRKSIAEDPTAHGYSAYGILQKRGSNAAIKEGLRDLLSDDAYVWMNAASYLGSRGHSEAVPYLIKALRHTASRSDAERIDLLQKLTGQSFGLDFDQWQRWYKDQPGALELNWDSSLGHCTPPNQSLNEPLH